MAQPQPPGGPAYKVKTISFLRREVPVVMQNENGPCPLLALANVLLLRNQIFLPPNTPDVTQDRLVALVAGRLLDANSEARAAALPPEQAAALRQGLADAVGLLPKLATGLDVNPRFHDVQGFEFTQDTGIFDLLDTRLVHGWLVDPQDEATAAALGDHSYNELVAALVGALGDDTPSHLLTPTAARLAASREGSSTSLAAGARQQAPTSGGPGPAAAAAASRLGPHADGQAAAAEHSLPSQLEGLQLSAEALDELQQAMALSLEPSPRQSPAGAPAERAQAPADWVEVQRSEAGPAEPPPAAAAAGAGENEGPVASSSGSSDPGPAPGAAAAAPEGLGPAYSDAQLAKGKMPAMLDVDPGAFRQQQRQAAAAETPAAPAAATPPQPQPDAAERRARELQRAQRVQDFLEATSSQLTEHGLVSLHQGLRDNELAVLFRNNHFNAIFSHGGSLWILVTDQGYLFEKDVVWERLCDISGDTEFAHADFSRFVGQPAARDVTAAADLARAAFAAEVQPQGGPDKNAVADPDADMALAMQLQQEEEQRQQRFLAQQRGEQQQREREPPAGSFAGAASRARAGGRGRGQPAGGRPKQDKCSIM